jgi:hypothetical protein
VLSAAAWVGGVDVRAGLEQALGSPTSPSAAAQDDDLTLVAQGDAVPAESEAPRPVAVHLPTLGISSDLLPLGLDDAGALEVPEDAHLAGWWTGGADPGERGPSVIVGHVDSHDGPGIFADLHELAPGDRVVVTREDGTAVHFDVERLEHHPKGAFPTEAVYGDTDGPELRLITCSGEFDRRARSYEDNLVVFLTVAGWSA